jgi:hypothetical protein
MGAGSATTTIQGDTGWDDRILMVSGSIDLILSGVTVSGGNSSSYGGGVYHYGNGINFDDVIFSGNLGAHGGGLYISAGNIAVLNNVKITGNSCTGLNCNGGGIENRGTLTMTDCEVEGNTAAGYGGGLYQFQGSAALTRVSFYDNHATHGGGIGANGFLTLKEGLLDRNHADQGADGMGGGIYILADSVVLKNVTVSGNTATGSGGGLFQSFANASVLNNVTITGNDAGLNTIYALHGGGMYLIESQMSVYNSLIAGNLLDGVPEIAGVDCSEFNTTILTGGYNIEGVKADSPRTCDFTGLGDQQGTTLSPIDPHLGVLADHGGPSETHMLLAGSPAIDAGNPAVPGSGGLACEATDQRGVPRPLGIRCDIGAYEGAFVFLPLIMR